MSAKLPESLSKNFEPLITKLKNLDEKNLYILFFAVLLLIFVLDFYVLMQPQLNALYKLTPNIKSREEDIAKTKDDISRLNQYKSEIERLSEEVEKVGSSVKSKEEVSIILEQLSSMADKNNVKIDQITPDFQEQSKILENKDYVYYKLPISIDARGGYHHFARFVNQLETSDIYLKISAFSIAYLPESKQNTIKLTVESIIYERIKKKDDDKAKN